LVQLNKSIDRRKMTPGAHKDSALEGILGPCELHWKNNYTIDPEGRVYKCPVVAGLPGLEVAQVASQAPEKIAPLLELRPWEKCGVRWLLLLIFVAGCTAPPGRESFVLKIAMWGPLGELAPTGDNEALASIAQPWVFERLFSLDATGQLKPGLAARVERLSGQRVRVELRRDATFSDGSSVTEEDVVRSLQAGGLQVIQSGGGLIVAPPDSALPVDALL